MDAGVEAGSATSVCVRGHELPESLIDGLMRWIFGGTYSTRICFDLYAAAVAEPGTPIARHIPAVSTTHQYNPSRPNAAKFMTFSIW